MTTHTKKRLWTRSRFSADDYSRGARLAVHDQCILDWLSQTQPRDEWSYRDAIGVVDVTHRVYTLLLLRFGGMDC
jgi:hypothetical protein